MRDLRGPQFLHVVTRKGKGYAPAEDYRNEPHTFGWMVEIDPFDPEAVPVKRTHLGRFAHEGVIFAPAVEGQPVVAYSGDDARFEYIYKFVSARPFQAATADGSLLDEGTLYVARFNDDGSGEWLALAPGENGLTPENGFADLADILVNTRAAADQAGATRMDRPEWGAVDPVTGQVYFTLTNNTKREEGQEDAANPRAENHCGHIIRWQEDGTHAAERFAWDLFVLAGDQNDSRDLAGEPLGHSLSPLVHNRAYQALGVTRDSFVTSTASWPLERVAALGPPTMKATGPSNVTRAPDS